MTKGERTAVGNQCPKQNAWSIARIALALLGNTHEDPSASRECRATGMNEGPAEHNDRKTTGLNPFSRTPTWCNVPPCTSETTAGRLGSMDRGLQSTAHDARDVDLRLVAAPVEGPLEGRSVTRTRGVGRFRAGSIGEMPLCVLTPSPRSTAADRIPQLRSARRTWGCSRRPRAAWSPQPGTVGFQLQMLAEGGQRRL